MLKFETLKYLKPMHFYKELCNALLSNIKREFLVPEAGNSKNDKNYQKT